MTIACRNPQRLDASPCTLTSRSLTYNLMVVDMADADRVFHALADATRRDIVATVLADELSVSELARRYPMSFAAVQKHVVVLEGAGLVTKQRHGREQRVRGNADTLRAAHRLLDQLEAIWRQRVDRIDDLLAEPEKGASPCP
jgi:DNA-binding transcriptional ArsR family regulator